MNVYDEAHNLAKAVKESNEYKEYMRLREETAKDEMLSKMLKDLQELQVAIQTAQITGQTIDESQMSQFQSVYAMLAAKPLAAEYMQAEVRFSMMVKDVFDILGDAINITR
ncbi:MAG: YlbF family regulator [Clostridiales bacterium]|nr:YlbF family regulator [Candidatus Crickella merdequi]